MARQSKREKQIENQCDQFMSQHLQGVQVDVFDLGKISAAGVSAGLAGQDIEAAVKAAIQAVRKN
jgi:hypothetical protein